MNESEIRQQVSEIQGEMDRIEVKESERGQRIIVSVVFLLLMFVASVTFGFGSWPYLLVGMGYLIWLIFAVMWEKIPMPDLRNLRIIRRRND